jgi:hypothetical protein
MDGGVAGGAVPSDGEEDPLALPGEGGVPGGDEVAEAGGLGGVAVNVEAEVAGGAELEAEAAALRAQLN